MILDYSLLVIVAVLGVGLTVIGGFVASKETWARLCFFIGGPILVLGNLAQGMRQIQAQESSDSVYMRITLDRREDRRASDTKIDSLYALLQPIVHPAERIEKPREKHSVSAKVPQEVPKEAPKEEEAANPGIKPLPAPPVTLPPVKQGLFTISQSSKPATRADANYQTQVVVQTTIEFPSLKFAMAFDKNLVDGVVSGPGGVKMAVSWGLVKDHPNIFIYSYGSSMPPFGPANPLVIDVWSKEPIVCNQVATF